MNLDHIQTKYSGTTTNQSKQIKFFAAPGQRNQHAFTSEH